MTMAMATAPAVDTIASGACMPAAVTGGGAIATASNTNPRRSSMWFAGPGPHATEGRGLLRAAGPLPANFAPLVQSALASLWMVATPPPVGRQNPRDVPG